MLFLGLDRRLIYSFNKRLIFLNEYYLTDNQLNIIQTHFVLRGLLSPFLQLVLLVFVPFSVFLLINRPFFCVWYIDYIDRS